MHSPSAQRLAIHHESDVSHARRAAQLAAESLGFGPEACGEIGLVAIELATNLLKHAGGGELRLEPIRTDGRVGIEVESSDHGPGIDDIELALTDRFSTAGSRGTGLGAVNRLMDELHIKSRPDAQTRVRCRKWVRVDRASTRPCPLAVGVATRPSVIGEANGDAFVVQRWGESLLVGVIDGLGHGPFARRAALAATNYVDSHYDQPLDQIFRGTGRACRATRGVVMALARFDWGRERMSFASVGNIETRVHPPSKSLQLPLRRGIVGLNAPTALVTEHAWTPPLLFILHSDGVRSHWNWKAFPALPAQPPAEIAQQLLRGLAKEADDATVLVVGSVQP